MVPSHTLYVNNINEKIKKKELRESLFYLFSQYGKILDVVALKTIKMRGQAFIVFEDMNAATIAMKQLQGFSFYDKMIKITYCKTVSKALRIQKGTFRWKQATEKKAVFVQGATIDMDLEALFSQVSGFIAVRRVPGKDDIAFVDFESLGDAEKAVGTLDGFENSLVVQLAQ